MLTLVQSYLPLSAQSQMMGRHAAAAAGSFYSPLHSMWGTAFGNTKQYSTFPYASKQESCAASEMPSNNNNNNDESYPMTSTANDLQNTSVSHPMDFKPPAESLISGLSAYSPSAGMISSAARKLPEGTAAAASSSHSAGCSPAASPTSYPYYCSTQDLASMYGSSFAMAGTPSSRSSLSASRPKPKNRTNAGKGGFSILPGGGDLLCFLGLGELTYD